VPDVLTGLEALKAGEIVRIGMPLMQAHCQDSGSYLSSSGDTIPVMTPKINWRRLLASSGSALAFAGITPVPAASAFNKLSDRVFSLEGTKSIRDLRPLLQKA
jgi:hypothetical protein